MSPLEYSGERKKVYKTRILQAILLKVTVTTLIVGTGFSLASFLDQTFRDQTERTTL